VKKPKRLFQREMPSIPPEADRLRDARKVIPPWQTFRIDMGGGRYQECTGADLIKTAEAFAALAEAQRRGDEEEIRRALKRIEADMDSIEVRQDPPPER
jgi:hypothetical protein